MDIGAAPLQPGPVQPRPGSEARGSLVKTLDKRLCQKGVVGVATVVT